MTRRSTDAARTVLRALALVSSAALGACGASSLPPRDTVHVKTEVHVVRGQVRAELGVSPDEARIRAAAAWLEKSFGRPVDLEIDAALLPSSRGEIVVLTANTLEELARVFSEQSRRDPLLYAFVQENLRHITARYRASVEGHEASFDEASGTLVWTMREPSRSSLVPSDYETRGTFEEAYARHLAAHFAMTGARVADGELDAYFRYLTTHLPSSDREAEREQQMTALLAFEPRVRGKAIHRDVEEYLAEHASIPMEKSMAGEANARMRTAFAHWVNERFFSLPRKEQGRVYSVLFRNDDCPSDPCPRWPELDRAPLALGFFDQKPPDDRADFDAFDEAICLYDEKDGKIERNRSCANVYEFLLKTEARTERLVAVLSAVRRRDYLVAALANARRQMPTLLRVLERKGGPLYADALRILSNLDFYGFRDQVYVLREQVTRLWPKRPDLRPLLFRILVEDRVNSGYRDDHFATLPDEFGPIDAALFAKFLDEGAHSIELLPEIWPALRDVSTPFEIVAPRLGAFVAARKMGASKTVAGLVRRACQAKDLEGLRVIRVVLQKRATSGDKDALALALAARDCKAPRLDSRRPGT